MKGEAGKARKGDGAASSPFTLHSSPAVWTRGVRKEVLPNGLTLLVQRDDSHERHLVVSNLCIANARYFGGGMKIAPDAKLTDGKLDIISIGDLSAMKIFTSAPRVYTGSHLSMPEVSHALARKITVRASDRSTEVALEVDGELPGKLPATFQIIPEALRVRVKS